MDFGDFPVTTIVVNYGVRSNRAPEHFPGRERALEPMMFRDSPGLSEKRLVNVTATIGSFFHHLFHLEVLHDWFGTWVNLMRLTGKKNEIKHFNLIGNGFDQNLFLFIQAYFWKNTDDHNH